MDYMLDLNTSAEVSVEFKKRGAGDLIFAQLAASRSNLTSRDEAMIAEYTRVIGSGQTSYRVSFANRGYQLCQSYPPIFIAPTAFDDEMLAEVSHFRSSGRIPAVVWISKSGGISISRSSQPMVGAWSRSQIDEEYIKAIR